MTLYVFGIRQPQHPDFAPAHFASLYCTQGDEGGRLTALVDGEKEAGREAYLHSGDTVGRDFFPVAPSEDLAAAMRRAGWVRCHAVRDYERAAADAAEVAYA